MAPLLVDSLEKIIKDICRKVILDDVMEKTQSTTSLIKFDVMSENVQKVKAGVGFGLNNLKKNKKTREGNRIPRLLFSSTRNEISSQLIPSSPNQMSVFICLLLPTHHSGVHD